MQGAQVQAPVRELDPAHCNSDERFCTPQLGLSTDKLINKFSKIYTYTHMYIYVLEEGVTPSPAALVVKDPTANAGDIIDPGLIPGSGRPPGEENGNPLHDSCLESP